MFYYPVPGLSFLEKTAPGEELSGSTWQPQAGDSVQRSSYIVLALEICWHFPLFERSGQRHSVAHTDTYFAQPVWIEQCLTCVTQCR